MRYWVILSMLIFSLPMAAQVQTFQTYTPDRQLSGDEKKKTEIKEGWNTKLEIGAGLSMNSSDAVIGQLDGDSRTYTANLLGAFLYKRNSHEWSQKLTVRQATSIAPALPRYVKAADNVQYETGYLYLFNSIPWLGPYARASVSTAIFLGEDVKADESTTYEITDLNGNVTTRTGGTQRLTDPFRPITTREALGALFRIYKQKWLTLEARLGFGAQQISADGQLRITADEMSMVRITELESSSQIGFEGGVDIKGSFDDKTSYSLSWSFLTPFGKSYAENNPLSERSTIELSNYELGAKLTSKIYSWAALNYEFTVRMQPELLAREQIQHLFTLNFNYSLL